MSNMYKTRDVASGDILSYYSANSLDNITIPLIKQEISNIVTKPRFRFNILNEDETVKEEIPQEDIILGGSYSENYQSGQRRNISLSLFNNTGKYNPSINGIWSGTKFSFDMGLELSNGNTIWFPKGVYVVNSANPSHTATDKTLSLELGDKFSILEGADGTLETSYTIPVGMGIDEVINNILKFNRGNGSFLDTKPIIYNEKFKDMKTQATITKEAGDNFGAIILDLATQLNAEVFYDTNGNLNFVPINDVTNDSDKPIIYSFFAENGDIASNNMSFDLSSVINRIIVVGGSSNSETYRAVSVNDNPASPLCYQRIGYKTASPINDTNITSKRLAQERADYELRQKLILKSSVSSEIRYNPLLMVNNLINITDEFFELKNESFLLQSISCPIDYSGSMSITTSNIKNIPFTVGRR